MSAETAGDEFDQALQRARAGDDEMLSNLLTRLGPQVRTELHISPKWRRDIDPDDVMQVTYIDVFLRIGSCAARHEGAFMAWLLQIARNNLRDAIRGLEAEKRPPVSRRIELNASANGDSYANLCDLIGATSMTPSRTVAQDELRTMIDAAIERLPSDYADVIRLLDLQGCSASEVSERMGRSRAAVHMLVGRARERLREVLGAGTRFFSR